MSVNLVLTFRSCDQVSFLRRIEITNLVEDVFDEEDECDTSDIEAAPTPPESPGTLTERGGVL